MKSKYIFITLFLALVASVATTPAAHAQVENEKQSQEIVTLFRAARKVISDNQAHINDATKGDKGLSAAAVVQKTKENFQNDLKRSVDDTPADSPTGLANAALLTAVGEVMTDAQVLINEQGKGFKGFLPAVFARQVAEKFNTGMNGRAFIKLTAPRDLLRNRSNRTDEWESSQIETKFRAAGWEHGKPVTEETTSKGRQAFRYLLPEYYGQSCLSCHGGTKGEIDITGGTKEGAKLGELGGAISFAIYLD